MKDNWLMVPEEEYPPSGRTVLTVSSLRVFKVSIWSDQHQKWMDHLGEEQCNIVAWQALVGPEWLVQWTDISVREPEQTSIIAMTSGVEMKDQQIAIWTGSVFVDFKGNQLRKVHLWRKLKEEEIEVGVAVVSDDDECPF